MIVHGHTVMPKAVGGVVPATASVPSFTPQKVNNPSAPEPFIKAAVITKQRRIPPIQKKDIMAPNGLPGQL